MFDLHLLLEDLYADMPGLPAALVCDGAEFSQPRFFIDESSEQQQQQEQKNEQQEQDPQPTPSSTPSISVLQQRPPTTMTAPRPEIPPAQEQQHLQATSHVPHSVTSSTTLTPIQSVALQADASTKVVEVIVDSD